MNKQCLYLDNDANHEFMARHIGPDEEQVRFMIHELGYQSMNEFIQAVIPQSIRLQVPLELGQGVTENEVLWELKEISRKNKVFKSYLGMGYADCVIPAVIQRNILENPGWYTAYTPYQAEIAQGRLEALLNFQTLISDLTGLPIANASLLDEATAAAEAMHMCHAIQEKNPAQAFFVSQSCHPQTIEVIRTRAEPLGIEVIVDNPHSFDFSVPVFGCLLSYPTTNGSIEDPSTFIEKAKKHGALVVISSDLLSLLLLKAPATLGADIVVGSAQRFGVPMGYGGPHAAYLATKEEFKRKVPGRIVGVSTDALGKPAIRLALQTREQHIRRERATSNICTAQVLLAVVAAMYAVYHGPKGLRKIAERIHGLSCLLKAGLEELGYVIGNHSFFDTLHIHISNPESQHVMTMALSHGMNFRKFDNGNLGITLDETTTERDVEKIMRVFHRAKMGHPSEVLPVSLLSLKEKITQNIPSNFIRQPDYLSHPVFNCHHSESEMLRYLHRLESKDLSLTTSMIPLGSCTMKLNATAQMMPITWDGFSKIHPFVPVDQVPGYSQLIYQLEEWLSKITGFTALSLQPNAGSQGEYAGLLVIRRYHQDRGEGHRNICLIPASAHGTNPASAVMAGMKVVVVKCDAGGNIDLNDLQSKAHEYRHHLSALMVTYPSTHGVFEETIGQVCQIIHDHGGQVYLDGANMNAQVGLCRPGDYGADVCHLNLHKTFCIPHGGGGPGMGPIGVKEHLKSYLPTHPIISTGGEKGIGAVSAAPWGSASILPISYAYIRLMGESGLKRASEVAILNANYMAKKLNPYFKVLYKGKNGLVAHECIVDCRSFKASSGVEVEDIAKRLMDYGFHAPTVSFPVPGTLMIEPTESESLEELDRFCEALILIRQEIKEIEEEKMDRRNNPLKNAPHTAEMISQETWDYPYSRERAVFPAPWLKEHKYWPSVSRIDNAYGDRNLICTCQTVAV